MRSPVSTMLRASDVLPASVRQEVVVAAGDELGPVFERDPIGGLDRRPMSQHLRGHVPPVLAVPDGPVDVVPHSYLSQRQVGRGPLLPSQVTERLHFGTG